MPNPDNSFQQITGGLQVGSNESYYGIGGGGIRYPRTWEYFEDGYTILGNITIYSASYNNYDHARLTITPGTEFSFAEGIQLQVGYTSSYYYGGELWAEGTEENPITFTSLNGEPGGWNGIYFENSSDNYSATSSLKYCTIENGNSYNVYCSSTVQPSLIENCTFKNSAGYGIRLYDADNLIFNDCEFYNTISNGLYSQYSSNLQFKNCNFTNHVGKGIELLNDSEYPIFTDCNISNIDGIGAYLNGSNSPQFIKCTIEECDTALYLVSVCQ